ncbi:MAG: hypothetical protein JXQ73_05010 [Phycisphaerae bacterium]|nr:hypothetical protein [Phycisphaerae bacterium]
MSDRTNLGTSIIAVLLVASIADAADESWYQALETKARLLEQRNREYHWIDGLYPSQVEVPWDGSPVDHSTNGISNVMHTVCWTANHLAGESYRYAFARKTASPEQASAIRDHVNAIFKAVHRCQKITGIKGFQARGYLYGHGPTYEERVNDTFADYWYQGVGKYKNLRWRGAPSHHNYSDAIHGLGVYYRLAAEGKHKDECRHAIDDLVSIWADNDLKIPVKGNGPGRHGHSMLLLSDGKTPTMPVIMVAAGLKVAHVATGKEKFAKLYEKIVTQFGFRKRTQFRRFSRLDADDAEHVFCHLDNLLSMEKDPELIRFYRVVLDALWASHGKSKCPLFNYIYVSLTPNAPDRDRALADALWTLQSHPTNMFFQPQMNSLRTDIKKDGAFSVEPMAVFECAWDNEYLWKGHLYQLDGWLSRKIVALDVAADDPMVIYAAEANGDLYRTGDGAQTWRWIGTSPTPNVLKLLCGQKRRILFLLTPTSAFRSVTGGSRWQQMALPDDCGALTDLQIDQTNPRRLYLITTRGVYRSMDFGEQWTGDRWECLTPIVPPANHIRLSLGQGKPCVVHGVFDDAFRCLVLDGSGRWSQAVPLGIRGYIKRYPWLISEPGNPKVLTTGFRIDFRDLDVEFLKGNLVGTLLSRSNDGGLTWTYGQESIMKRLQDKGAPAVLLQAMADLVPHFLEHVAADPQAPETLYAVSGGNFFVGKNRGRYWTEIKAGLDIPKVDALFVPRAGEMIYASTPAGLYRLKRGQNCWESATLRLQFDRNTRRDLGGAAYLDAYWRGRYFGFITDEQAVQAPSKWLIPERYRKCVPR